jgi:hypothetical protein
VLLASVELAPFGAGPLYLEYMGFVLAQLPWVPLRRRWRTAAHLGQATVLLACLGFLWAHFDPMPALALWGAQLFTAMFLLSDSPVSPAPRAPRVDLSVEAALARARGRKSERAEAEAGQLSLPQHRATQGAVSVAPSQGEVSVAPHQVPPTRSK